MLPSIYKFYSSLGLVFMSFSNQDNRFGIFSGILKEHKDLKKLKEAIQAARNYDVQLANLRAQLQTTITNENHRQHMVASLATQVNLFIECVERDARYGKTKQLIDVLDVVQTALKTRCKISGKQINDAPGGINEDIFMELILPLSLLAGYVGLSGTL